MSALDAITVSSSMPPARDVEHTTRIRAAGAIVAIANRLGQDPRTALEALFAPLGPIRCAECHRPIRTVRVGRASRCSSCAEKRRRRRA